MSFDFQPTLSGPTLTLRPMTVDDFDALYAVASDPLIWDVHPMHDRWQEPVFRAFFDQGIASGGALTVTDRASGSVIGSSRYSTDYPEHGEVEIGWTFLARDYWGGITNRELKHLMLTHAFGDFDRVLFSIGEGNIRSRRACENIGGQLLERQQTVQAPNGATMHVIYGIDRAGFTGLI